MTATEDAAATARTTTRAPPTATTKHRHHLLHDWDGGGYIDHRKAGKNTAATQNAGTGVVGRRRRGPRRITAEEASSEPSELTVNVGEGDIVKTAGRTRRNLTKRGTWSTSRVRRAIEKQQGVGLKSEPRAQHRETLQGQAVPELLVEVAGEESPGVPRRDHFPRAVEGAHLSLFTQRTTRAPL
jgi:hypothetical protein